MKATKALGAVIALTLVSGVAFAEPLQLRHDAPASNEPASPISAGYKLAGFAVVAAGVAYWMKKKRREGLGAKAATPAPVLRVISRASVGARSDLLVVEIGERRVLLGATPSSINHLVDLDAEDVEMREPVSMLAAPRTREVDVSRFHALLDDVAKHEVDKKADDAPIETQAKNLLMLRRRT